MSDHPKVRWHEDSYGWVDDGPPTHKVVPLDALVIERDKNGEWLALGMERELAVQGAVCCRLHQGVDATAAGCPRSGAEGEAMSDLGRVWCWFRGHDDRQVVQGVFAGEWLCFRCGRWKP